MLAAGGLLGVGLGGFVDPFWWDLGFLACGAVLLALGLVLVTGPRPVRPAGRARAT